MTATVIIPTTGSDEVKHAIDSVLSQTYSTKCYVVADGRKFHSKTRLIAGHHKNLEICYLPLNVGANGFYGHRVYAAFTHLLNTDYVLYLDQDNWFDSNHVSSCIDTIQSKNLDWCYSLRKICDKNGEYICNDDCESLGKWPTYHGANHVDTNTYCIKTAIATKLASAWHGGWGQDRVFLQAISHHFKQFDCTGEYTVNYRLAGNEGSVTKQFFENGNKIMNDKYNGEFPWKRKV